MEISTKSRGSEPSNLDPNDDTSTPILQHSGTLAIRSTGKAETIFPECEAKQSSPAKCSGQLAGLGGTRLSKGTGFVSSPGCLGATEGFAGNQDLSRAQGEHDAIGRNGDDTQFECAGGFSQGVPAARPVLNLDDLWLDELRIAAKRYNHVVVNPSPASVQGTQTSTHADTTVANDARSFTQVTPTSTRTDPTFTNESLAGVPAPTIKTGPTPTPTTSLTPTADTPPEKGPSSPSAKRFRTSSLTSECSSAATAATPTSAPTPTPPPPSKRSSTPSSLAKRSRTSPPTQPYKRRKVSLTTSSGSSFSPPSSSPGPAPQLAGASCTSSTSTARPPGRCPGGQAPR